MGIHAHDNLSLALDNTLFCSQKIVLIGSIAQLMEWEEAQEILKQKIY